MITKYLIQFPVGKAVAGYNTAGVLVFWEVTDDVPTDVLNWLYSKNALPRLESDCRAIPAHTKQQVKVNKMLTDTSFDAFWEAYGYKVGKKERTIKLWNTMTHVERESVLRSIPIYKKWLSGRSVDMVYPETYLSQRRWENEFK